MSNKLAQFFSYSHLPQDLQVISKPFHELAQLIDSSIALESEEKDMALRKLLEAKDCAVRAKLFNPLSVFKP